MLPMNRQEKTKKKPIDYQDSSPTELLLCSLKISQNKIPSGAIFESFKLQQ